jgi:hypothetical protein
MQIIDYLTAILVLVTAIYSYLTYKMANASEASVQAMREQSEAMLRPYITISAFVRPHTPFLYLRIENTGKTAAENLQLSMNKDFFQFGEANRPDRNLRTMKAFVEPIRSLPPGGKLIFVLGQGFVIFAEDADQAAVPRQFTVRAVYHFGAKKIDEVNHIDLMPYIGSEGERDPVVDELEKLRKLIEKRQ